MQDDLPEDWKDKIFGNGTSAESDHVCDVWKNPEGDTVFQQTRNKVLEKSFKSVAREPLGKSFNRGHTMPKVITDDPTFRQGIKSEKGKTAVEVLQMQDLTEEEVEREKLYVRTHGSYPPGVQKKR